MVKINRRKAALAGVGVAGLGGVAVLADAGVGTRWQRRKPRRVPGSSGCSARHRALPARQRHPIGPRTGAGGWHWWARWQRLRRPPGSRPPGQAWAWMARLQVGARWQDGGTDGGGERCDGHGARLCRRGRAQGGRQRQVPVRSGCGEECQHRTTRRGPTHGRAADPRWAGQRRDAFPRAGRSTPGTCREGA